MTQTWSIGYCAPHWQAMSSSCSSELIQAHLCTQIIPCMYQKVHGQNATNLKTSFFLSSYAVFISSWWHWRLIAFADSAWIGDQHLAGCLWTNATLHKQKNEHFSTHAWVIFVSNTSYHLLRKWCHIWRIFPMLSKALILITKHFLKKKMQKWTNLLNNRYFKDNL